MNISILLSVFFLFIFAQLTFANEIFEQDVKVKIVEAHVKFSENNELSKQILKNEVLNKCRINGIPDESKILCSSIGDYQTSCSIPCYENSVDISSPKTITPLNNYEIYDCKNTCDKPALVEYLLNSLYTKVVSMCLREGSDRFKLGPGKFVKRGEFIDKDESVNCFYNNLNDGSGIMLICHGLCSRPAQSDFTQ